MQGLKQVNCILFLCLLIFNLWLRKYCEAFYWRLPFNKSIGKGSFWKSNFFIFQNKKKKKKKGYVVLKKRYKRIICNKIIKKRRHYSSRLNWTHKNRAQNIRKSEFSILSESRICLLNKRKNIFRNEIFNRWRVIFPPLKAQKISRIIRHILRKLNPPCDRISSRNEHSIQRS